MGKGGGHDFQRLPYDTRDLFTTSAQREMGGDINFIIKRQMETFQDAAQQLRRNPTDPEAFKQIGESLLALIKELPAAIKHWTDSLVDSQRHLQNFSGVIANAFQEAQVRQAVRDIQSGQRTGNTTKELIDAQQAFEDMLQPYRDLGTNVSNKLATWGQSIENWVFRAVEAGTGIDELVDAINKWIGKMDEEAIEKGAAFDMMDGIRQLPDRLTKRPL